VGKNHRSVWYSGLVGYDAIADGIVWLQDEQTEQVGQSSSVQLIKNMKELSKLKQALNEVNLG
jgi:uncharacterized protein YbcV (DUF1398 family)